VPAPCRAEGACRGVMGGRTAKLTTGHVVPRGAASLMHTPSWGSKRTVATWWRMMEARWAGTELLTWLKASGQVAPLASIMSTRYGLARGSREVGTSLHPLDPRHLRPNSVSTVMRGQTIANRLSPTTRTSVGAGCHLPTLTRQSGLRAVTGVPPVRHPAPAAAARAAVAEPPPSRPAGPPPPACAPPAPASPPC